MDHNDDSPMKNSALLFDLDGTILHTLPDITQSANHLRAHYGLPDWEEDRVRRCIGGGVARLIELCLEDAELTLTNEMRNDALSRYRSHHEEHLLDRTSPYAGAIEGLRSLASQGFPLAVVSNKPEHFTRTLVRHFVLEEIFPVVIGGDSASEKKPSPIPLQLACQQLGSKTEKAWMIGDSPSDMEAGHAANCAACVGVTWGYRDKTELAEAPSTLLVSDFAQLLTALV